jgi:rhodanese-related sulfurtransferase
MFYIDATGAVLVLIIIAVFVVVYKPSILNKMYVRVFSKPMFCPFEYAYNIGSFGAGHKFFCVFDVRTQDEFEEKSLKNIGNHSFVHIPIPYGNGECIDNDIKFRGEIRRDSLLKYAKEKGATVLVVCSYGMRSARACYMLQILGFNPVHLQGGLERVSPEFVHTKTNKDKKEISYS